MDKNTRAARSCFHHHFLVFGYPSETLALIVHILLHKGYAMHVSEQDDVTMAILAF